MSSLLRHRDPDGQHRRWSKAIDVGYWDSRSVGYQIAGSRVGLDTSWCGCTYTPIPTNPPGYIRMHVDWIGRVLKRVALIPKPVYQTGLVAPFQYAHTGVSNQTRA